MCIWQQQSDAIAVVGSSLTDVDVQDTQFEASGSPPEIMT